MSETVKSDYETVLGDHYDTSSIDPVFGVADCSVAHLVTGRPCVYPLGHQDHHWAMGLRRMQAFGPHLAEAKSGGVSDAE